MSSVLFAFGPRSLRRDSATLVRVDRVLSSLCDESTAIWSGDANGADQMVLDWAEAAGRCVESWPADWERDGRAAGVIRTKRLVAELPGDARAVCFLPVAFPGGEAIVAAGGLCSFVLALPARGSAHSLGLCRDFGVPVVVSWACGRLTPVGRGSQAAERPEQPLASSPGPADEQPLASAHPAEACDPPSDFCGDVVWPIGKHKGTTLKNVPCTYLRFMLNQEWFVEKFGELAVDVITHLARRTGVDAKPPEGWQVREGVLMRDDEALGDDWRDARAQRLAARRQDPKPDVDGWDHTDPDYDIGFAPFGDVFEEDPELQKIGEHVHRTVEPDAFGDHERRSHELGQTRKRVENNNEMHACRMCHEAFHGTECPYCGEVDYV